MSAYIKLKLTNTGRDIARYFKELAREYYLQFGALFGLILLACVILVGIILLPPLVKRGLK